MNARVVALLTSTLLASAARAEIQNPADDARVSLFGLTKSHAVESGTLGFALTADRLALSANAGRASWHEPLADWSGLADIAATFGPLGVYAPSHHATIISWLHFDENIPLPVDDGLPPEPQEPGTGGGDGDVRPVPAPAAALLAAVGAALVHGLRRRVN
jgi:hypothetical protein